MPGYPDPGFDTLALHAGAGPDPATAADRIGELLGRVGLATRLGDFGVTGDDVGALLFPRADECCRLAGLPAGTPLPAGKAVALLNSLLPLRWSCCLPQPE